MIILIPLISTILITLFVIILCALKRICVAKKTSKEDHNQQPTYEEITQYHKDNVIIMEENAAYVKKTHNQVIDIISS